MKNKFRKFISGLLYVVALFSFLGAITATSRGSMLDFSNLARLNFPESPSSRRQRRL